MKIDKMLIIPQVENFSEYIKVAQEYGLGFEYNDFYIPGLLDNPDALDARINFYNMPEHRAGFSTMHGAFFDVTIFSDDPKIREVSQLRVNQSLETAKKLGVSGVVFHTNYIPNFYVESYQDSWVKKNEAFWRKKAEEYPMLNLYMENMFDMDCTMLARLGETMKDCSNFGICFDYAHAHVFGEEKHIEHWVSDLAPFVKHIHINDNDLKRDLHLAVGDGRIDWQQFKLYYEKYFMDASVLIEVTGLTKIKQSIEYLDKL